MKQFNEIKVHCSSVVRILFTILFLRVCYSLVLSSINKNRGNCAVAQPRHNTVN